MRLLCSQLALLVDSEEYLQKRENRSPVNNIIIFDKLLTSFAQLKVKSFFLLRFMKLGKKLLLHFADHRRY